MIPKITLWTVQSKNWKWSKYEPTAGSTTLTEWAGRSLIREAAPQLRCKNLLTGQLWTPQIWPLWDICNKRANIKRKSWAVSFKVFHKPCWAHSKDGKMELLLQANSRVWQTMEHPQSEHLVAALHQGQGSRKGLMVWGMNYMQNSNRRKPVRTD